MCRGGVGDADANRRGSLGLDGRHGAVGLPQAIAAVGGSASSAYVPSTRNTDSAAAAAILRGCTTHRKRRALSNSGWARGARPTQKQSSYPARHDAGDEDVATWCASHKTQSWTGRRGARREAYLGATTVRARDDCVREGELSAADGPKMKWRSPKIGRRGEKHVWGFWKRERHPKGRSGCNESRRRCHESGSGDASCEKEPGEHKPKADEREHGPRAGTGKIGESKIQFPGLRT